MAHGFMLQNSMIPYSRSESVDFDSDVSSSYSDSTFSASDKEKKGPSQACLFVGGFDQRHTSAEKLKKIFEQYGEVLEVNVLSDTKPMEGGKYYKNRGYAFVQFKHIFDADNAKEALNNTPLDGKSLRVEKAQSPRTLYLSKIDKNWTPKQVESFLASQNFGPIEHLTLLKDQNGNNKGACFAKFVYRQDAMKCFEALKANKSITVEWAKKKRDLTIESDSNKCQIFVGGLQEDITEAQVLERFKKYQAGQKSNYAFITFANAMSAALAIEQENGSNWNGRQIRVQYCESAETKAFRHFCKLYTSGGPHYAIFQMYSAGWVVHLSGDSLTLTPIKDLTESSILRYHSYIAALMSIHGSVPPGWSFVPQVYQYPPSTGYLGQSLPAFYQPVEEVLTSSPGSNTPEHESKDQSATEGDEITDHLNKMKVNSKEN